eukprot:Partr_v1_DN25345_c0_g1_i6_m21664 putative Endonuclease that specifically degrades the RNA of RNA- DNA hybrids (By similarity)
MAHVHAGCLGVDEAGRGPVLGPMVYGIAFCPVGRQMELRERGMDDSKKLTHETRQMLFDKGSEFNDWFGWSVHALSPQDISSVMLRRDKYNLNTLSHDTTIGLIKSALDRGVNVTEVYVDTVGSPEKYQVLLSTHFPQLKITVAKKADSLYPIVSAASIFAKVTRDTMLENWKFVESGFEECDVAQLGSGYPGDPNTKKWLSSNLQPVFGFPGLIRFSWSTCGNLLETGGVYVRWPYEDEEEEAEMPAFKKQKKEVEAKARQIVKEVAEGRGKFFKSMHLSSMSEFSG